MGNYVPQSRDRLGFRRPWNSAYYALDAASTAIPAGQTIVVLNWCRHDKGALVATDHYVGVGASETGAGHRASMLRNGDTIKLGAYAGAWQLLSVPIPDDGDHLWALVVDRDNTQLEAWLDGVKVNSAALTQNPVLTANNQILFNNSTGQLYSDTHWKGAVFSLTAAATPTAAEWAWIFKAIQNPEAPLPALFTGKIAAHNAMWRFGEGLYGSTTIVNERNPGTDDLAIQDGVAIQTVRTRARTPWRRPRRTYYMLKPGYTATTGNVDFGFAAQPVIARVVAGRSQMMTVTDAVYLGDPGGTDYLARLRCTTIGDLRWWQRAASGAVFEHIMRGDQRFDNDAILVIDGRTWKTYLNGQLVFQTTINAPIDPTGLLLGSFAGNGGAVCRIAAWNPAAVPATLEAEIRACVCNPEIDPPSLTDKRVDFPLHSGLLPLGTETTVANQGLGGGTLTLSAARSTSCEPMLVGYDP